MVRPSARIRLRGNGHPGRLQFIRKADGHHDAVLRPFLLPAHRQRRCAEQVPPVKADLAFLHPDGGIGKSPFQVTEQRFIQRQLQLLAVKEKQNVISIILRRFHIVHLFYLIISRLRWFRKTLFFNLSRQVLATNAFFRSKRKLDIKRHQVRSSYI